MAAFLKQNPVFAVLPALSAGLLGSYMIVAELVAVRYPPRLFITAHTHLLLVGLMLMMVMGVATWMFPRPARDNRRYRPELAERCTGCSP